MATPSSILAWRLPWTEESRGEVQGCLKESDATEHTDMQTPKGSSLSLVLSSLPPFFLLACLSSFLSRFLISFLSSLETV